MDYTQDADCIIAYLMAEGVGTSLNDYSPNSNTGILLGTNIPSWSSVVPTYGSGSGGPFNSILFDTATGRIVVASDPSINNIAPFSYVGWLKTSSPLGNDRVFAKRNSPTAQKMLFFTVGGGTPRLNFEIDTTVAPNMSRSSSQAYSTNVWTHFGVTWEGTLSATGIKIYYNAVEVSGYTSSTNGAGSVRDDSTESLCIGNRINDLARPFPGLKSEMAFFSRVLSSTEISEIYNYGLLGNSRTATITQALISVIANTTTASKQVNKTATLTQAVISIISGTTVGEIPSGAVDNKTATVTQSFISIITGTISASRLETRTATLTQALISLITNTTTTSRLESRTADLILQNISIITNTTTASRSESRTSTTVNVAITIIANDLTCSKTVSKIATLTQGLIQIITGTLTASLGVEAFDFGITLLVESRIEKQPVFNSRISKFIEDESPFNNRLTLKSQIIH